MLQGVVVILYFQRSENAYWIVTVRIPNRINTASGPVAIVWAVADSVAAGAHAWLTPSEMPLSETAVQVTRMELKGDGRHEGFQALLVRDCFSKPVPIATANPTALTHLVAAPLNVTLGTQGSSWPCITCSPG
jgi:hypothetical protein